MHIPTVRAPRDYRYKLPRYVHDYKSQLLNLCAVYGAVLMRDFSPTVQMFECAVDAFQMEKIQMLGSAAPRTKVSKSVYTANDSPPSCAIPFHHEMAQTRRPPSHIFFFCSNPAKVGGETPLLDSRSVCDFVRNEHPKMHEKLQHGVRYRRVLPEADDADSPIGRSWRNTFACNDRYELEDFLDTSQVEYKWRADGDLWTQTPLMPVFDRSPDGHDTFFNSIIAAYNGWNDSRNVGAKCVVHHDDTYLDASFMHDLNEFALENRIEFAWRRGDVLMVDNRLMMHSRNTFTPPRRILTTIRRESSA